jgi:hypothetical protein
MHVGTGQIGQKKRGIMKTIALTLFTAALGFAQSPASSAAPATPAATPAPKATAVPKKTTKAAAAPAQKSSAQNKKPAQPAKLSPEQQAKAQQIPTVPAEAKQVGPNLYRLTDSNGKTWNYRKTPFGVSKWEEASTPAPQPVVSQPIAVTDLGDSYRFEKKTPFGASTWVRKKSELTDQEKALASGQPTQPDGSGTTVVSKPAEQQ